MDLSLSTWWWIVAGALVAAELATGTFYLLMVAIGCAAGALAAHAQLAFFPQAIVAATVGGGLVLAWHRLRARSPAPVPPQANRDINLVSDVFLFYRASGTIQSVSTGKQPWMEPSISPAIDDTGTVVAFSSRHPMDAHDDANDFDLFVWCRSSTAP